MIAFRGFLIESKAYMSYDTRSRVGKIRFWLAYPKALARYYYAQWKDR